MGRWRRHFAVATGVAVVFAGFAGEAAAAPPPNDDFASAQSLPSGSTSASGTTAEATTEPGEPDHPGGDKISVWYAWRVTGGRHTATIYTCPDGGGDGFAVYTGAALGSLQRIGAAPSQECRAVDGLEFTAEPGTTYWIAVTSDTFETRQGPFTLRIEADLDPVRDLSLAQRASRTRIKRGQTVTYTVRITNRGNVPMTRQLGLISSQPFRLAQPVPETRYLRLRSTRGTCRRLTYFREHRGAACRFKSLPPGASMTVTAVVRPQESLTHWIFIDPGDSNRANDSIRKTRVTTFVKPR